MSRGSAPLRVVDDVPAGEPVLPTGKALEEVIRLSVGRRAMLRRDATAEEARLKWLGRQLANERGVAFIRLEAIEREFASEAGR